MPKQSTPPEPIQLFYSYAHEDEALRKKLETHLKLLERQGLLAPWHDRMIQAGTEWAHKIDEHLNTASLILLLISPDFLASDYYYDIEMQRAMERHQLGEARVIPIILRPCDWQSAPFGALEALPRDGRAITTWEMQNQDAAFLEVEQSLRKIIEHRPTRSRPSRTSSMARQNRENMLLRLQTMYEELLVDSLQEVAWIELGTLYPTRSGAERCQPAAPACYSDRTITPARHIHPPSLSGGQPRTLAAG